MESPVSFSRFGKRLNLRHSASPGEPRSCDQGWEDSSALIQMVLRAQERSGWPVSPRWLNHAF